MVWDLMAGELLPMVNTGNWLLNILNNVLAHAHKQPPNLDALKIYVAQFCVRPFVLPPRLLLGRG